MSIIDHFQQISNPDLFNRGYCLEYGVAVSDCLRQAGINHQYMLFANEIDEDEGYLEVAHIGVLLDNGMVIDALGIRHPDEILKQCYFMNPGYLKQVITDDVDYAESCLGTIVPQLVVEARNEIDRMISTPAKTIELS